MDRLSTVQGQPLHRATVGLGKRSGLSGKNVGNSCIAFLAALEQRVAGGI
jgi:hypothetical protein